MRLDDAHQYVAPVSGLLASRREHGEGLANACR